MRTSEHARAWKPVVDAVHEKGSIFYAQLWHMGRQGHSSHHFHSKRTVSASDIALKNQKVKTIDGQNVDGEVPHALTKEEIKETVQDYAKAALVAKEAGFDGVEIHSANGYLIDQFFQTCTNHRTDEYGGSVENRTRILREVVEAIVDSGAFPVERIGFRLSPNGAYGDMGSEDNYETFLRIAEIMNEYNLAYLHVMDGLGFGFHNKCEPLTAMDFRKVWNKPLLVNVGLTRDMAEGMLRSGAADAAVFGRLYISNPDLAERFENDWPVEPEAPHGTWWGSDPLYTDAHGYTDWPTYQEQLQKQQSKAEGSVATNGKKIAQVETQ
jgi:N-ethylmaleimide reductase